MRSRCSAHGFTMIELIMLIVIGAFVVGGIVAFTRNVTENTITLKDRLVALDLAQKQMETELNAYYGSVFNGTSVCRDSAEDRAYNLAVGNTDTVHGGFTVRRTVTETVTLTPVMHDYSQPLGPDPLDPWCIGLKRIDILVDYTGGSFVNPLIRLNAFKASGIVDDTEVWP